MYQVSFRSPWQTGARRWQVCTRRIFLLQNTIVGFPQFQYSIWTRIDAILTVVRDSKRYDGGHFQHVFASAHVLQMKRLIKSTILFVNMNLYIDLKSKKTDENYQILIAKYVFSNSYFYFEIMNHSVFISKNLLKKFVWVPWKQRALYQKTYHLF